MKPSKQHPDLPIVLLDRIHQDKNNTIGKLDELYTIERPWIDNKVRVSCIPEGEYLVLPDNTGRFQYFSVKNVTNRSAIEIHPANYASELMGCIAPGLRLNNKFTHVLDSRKACYILKGRYPKGFILRIENKF
jgi:hypothetical protein